MYAGKTFDWPLIRSMYERGMSAAEITRNVDPAPTRQAINQKAKRQGWGKVIVKGNRDNLPAALVSNFNKDTPEVRTKVLELISTGCSQAVAARAVGVDPTTLTRWKGSDADFANAVEASRAAFLARHHANIDKAGERDWRASSYLLERQDETKGQYSPKVEGHGGITVVLNIHRDEEEQDAIDGEYERID